MEVRVWRSFAANNSSSCYLVGRFASTDAASQAATDLRRFLFKLADELDAMDATERLRRTGPTPLGVQFAEAHGFEWGSRRHEEQAEDEEVDVLSIGDQLLIYHDYCLGFDDGLRNYIKATGGSLEFDNDRLSRPMLSLLAAIDDPSIASALADRLRREGEPAIAFFDGHVAGHVASLEPARIEELKAWLSQRGITEVEMTIDRHQYAHRFAAMGTQACPACASSELRYLPAFLFDADEDQVACQACGGMYGAAGFFEGHVAHLVFVAPDGRKGPRVCFDPLVKERALVGRGRRNDVLILNPNLSRHHCAVEFVDGQFVATDLGSENGTSIGGVLLERGERYPLEDGDEIDLPVDMRVRVSLLPRE